MEIRGHNLNPLFAAIEERTLLRVCARLGLAPMADHKPDTYVTEIVFSKRAFAPVRRRRGQLEIDLGVQLIAGDHNHRHRALAGHQSSTGMVPTGRSASGRGSRARDQRRGAHD